MICETFGLPLPFFSVFLFVMLPDLLLPIAFTGLSPSQLGERPCIPLRPGAGKIIVFSFGI